MYLFQSFIYHIYNPLEGFPKVLQLFSIIVSKGPII